MRRFCGIGGKDGYEITKYEINTALIECLNSVEKRAAVETPQDVDRADIKPRGSVNEHEEMLRRAFTFEELAAIDARMRTVIDVEQGKSAPPANIIDLKPVLEAVEKHETTAPDVDGGEGKRPSWRD